MFMPKRDFSKRFKILEEIATADVAFEAYGSTETEMFENAAFAVEETMVNTSAVKQTVRKNMRFESDELEKLLFDFLSELVYFKDAEALLFSSFKVRLTKEGKKLVLDADVSGEPIDHVRHDLRNDIKAITWHMFKIEQLDKGWKCRIIVDV